MKIRCRSRRTSSSTCCQSIDSQSVISSSGPFTTATPAAAASRLPSSSLGVQLAPRFRRRRSSVLHRLTWPTSAPFRVRATSPYPASYAGPTGGGAGHSCPGFLPPFGRRHSLLGPSCSRRGVRPSSRSAYRTSSAARTPTGFPRSTRARHDRGGRPLYPGDGGVLPADRLVSSRRLPLPSGQSLHPAGHIPSAGLERDEASSGVHSRSPVRSSPRLWPPDGTGALGLLPRASHPAVTRDARQGGDRPWTLARNYTFDISRTSNRCVHSSRATSCRTEPAFPVGPFFTQYRLGI